MRRRWWCDGKVGHKSRGAAEAHVRALKKRTDGQMGCDGGMRGPRGQETDATEDSGVDEMTATETTAEAPLLENVGKARSLARLVDSERVRAGAMANGRFRVLFQHLTEAELADLVLAAAKLGLRRRG